jgi:uncharacterized coiled-coil protein SlyX
MWTSIVTFFTGIWGSVSTYFIEIVVVLAVVGAVYLYWTGLEHKIETLTTQNANLTSTVNDQNKTITTLQQDFKKTQQELNDLNNKYSNIDVTKTTLDKNFDLSNVTDTNKTTIETQTNQDFNNIFTTLNTQTIPDSFTNTTGN